MANASRAKTKRDQGLHVCPGCGSDLVQPTGWEQAGGRGQWRLWRRCPECGWLDCGVFGDREIDAYDEALESGTDLLADTLRELERENMEWIAAAFATALANDLIGPDDFA